MAATIALAMIGPMPGTVINCRQLSVPCANCSNSLAKETKPLADGNAALQQEAADLIDHGSALANQVRSHAV
jgi:hypothetical protein